MSVVYLLFGVYSIAHSPLGSTSVILSRSTSDSLLRIRSSASSEDAVLILANPLRVSTTAASIALGLPTGVDPSALTPFLDPFVLLKIYLLSKALYQCKSFYRISQ